LGLHLFYFFLQKDDSILKSQDFFSEFFGVDAEMLGMPGEAEASLDGHQDIQTLLGD
jgi:hypothetical protein